jgi:catechol 2,3-dioxygenase-like lactoylglutathione lyase family enzyme
MITGAHHVAISVRNLEDSISFYRDKMELDLAVPPFPFGGEMIEQIQGLKDARGRMCVMRKNSLMLELFEYEAPKPAGKDPNYSVGDRGISHFGMEVEDIENTVERMRSAGVRFHSDVKLFPSGMKAAYGRDNDGNVFELLEMS